MHHADMDMHALVYNGPGQRAWHRFALADVMKVYDTFGNAAVQNALKVVLENAG